tara:strand:- start:461 stop:1030 length:570 start_codon:yes stop_codon:yes gene_type:complete
MLGLGNSITSQPYIEYGGNYLLVEITNASVTPSSATLKFNDGNLTSVARELGDKMQISFEAYLSDPGGWDGTDAVGFRVGAGQGGSVSNFIGDAFPQNTLTTINNTVTGLPANWTNAFQISFTVTNDRPDFGSKFYMKDLVIVILASDDTVKDTITYNFSNSGDISMVTGQFNFSSSNATITKGNSIPE